MHLSQYLRNTWYQKFPYNLYLEKHPSMRALRRFQLKCLPLRGKGEGVLRNGDEEGKDED